MSSTSPPETSPASATSHRVRQVLDAVVYANAVAGVVFALGVLVGLAVGGGLVTAKHVMFVVGILGFGYATLQLRPDPPWGTERTDEGELRVTKNEPRGRVVDDREETTFQSAVRRIPPLPWFPLPPSERLSVALKMFLASLTVLAWSFMLETVFGVTAVAGG